MSVRSKRKQHSTSRKFNQRYDFFKVKYKIRKSTYIQHFVFQLCSCDKFEKMISFKTKKKSLVRHETKANGRKIHLAKYSQARAHCFTPSLNVSKRVIGLYPSREFARKVKKAKQGAFKLRIFCSLL